MESRSPTGAGADRVEDDGPWVGGVSEPERFEPVPEIPCRSRMPQLGCSRARAGFKLSSRRCTSDPTAKIGDRRSSAVDGDSASASEAAARASARMVSVAGSIAIPDHTHAVASAAAIRAGKHVFCEKPLTRTVHESRALRELARKHKVATSMGNQGTASGPFRRALELIRKGDFSRAVAGAALDQKMCLSSAATFIFTAIFARSTWKYRQRAFRYIYIDAGHMGQNLALAAASLSLCGIQAGS